MALLLILAGVGNSQFPLGAEASHAAGFRDLTGDPLPNSVCPGGFGYDAAGDWAGVTQAKDDVLEHLGSDYEPTGWTPAHVEQAKLVTLTVSDIVDGAPSAAPFGKTRVSLGSPVPSVGSCTTSTFFQSSLQTALRCLIRDPRCLPPDTPFERARFQLTDEIHLLVFNTSSGNPPYIWLECGNFSEVSPPLGTITGTKFEDLDGDGNDREGGEPGVSGWTINISGPVDDSTTTNSSGNYSFEDLPAGSYQVSEKPRSGWTQSYPAGNKHTVVIPKTGGTQGSVDFANFRPAELSGVKFLDNDGDGAREGGAGLSGWQINLQGLDGRGNKVNLATTTNSSGQYSFSVPPGTYSVTEKQRDGWVQTAPQPNPKAGYTRAVQSGEEVGGLDFGNAELGSVSGLKWRDQNADGVQDAGEPRLGGWEIRLDGETGKGAPVHRTTTTDAAGTYAFADLAPGSYVVSEVLQEGWRQTYPAEGSYAVTIKS
jgi:hypothetical protein